MKLAGRLIYYWFLKVDLTNLSQFDNYESVNFTGSEKTFLMLNNTKYRLIFSFEIIIR